MMRQCKLGIAAALFAGIGCQNVPPVRDGGPSPPPRVDGGSSTDGGALPVDGGASPADGGTAANCSAAPLLASLGRAHLLVGASMSAATAAAAPFDLRYIYIAGGIFDGTAPCASCAGGCMAGGQSCANSNPNGCAWWGCWQWDQQPPGQYLRDFLDETQALGQIPMITYYQILQASGATEGSGEVQAAVSTSFMTRYFNDWRFLLQTIGDRVVFLHVEPDFWGYVEQENADPHAIPAAVSAASPDCSGLESSAAGLARCFVVMARRYAPNAKIGLHASGWATKMDVLGNTDPSLDIAAEARKLGDYLLELGVAATDFVVADASDRDAGYYASIGRSTFWDATNASLPNFHQAFAWATVLAERVGLPVLWWQLPVGNMSLPNRNCQWQDNRVDYFFGHLDELVASHAVGMAFGAGAGCQTTPETDNGNLVARTLAYGRAGGVAACP
jgi:hypothetical protein